MTQTEALKMALEALKGAEALLSSMGLTHLIVYGDVEKAVAEIEESLEQQSNEQVEPVAWRDHVEQRLLTWRQSFVNRSGDQLALDDFMDKRSLDDLIEFVCDEYTIPPPVPTAQPEQEYKRGYADAMNWKVQNHLEHFPTAQPKEPEQEHVAKAVVSKRKTDEHHITDIDLTLTEAGKRLGSGEHCLYTTPPQRKPLTDEQITEIAATPAAIPGSYVHSFARAIEAAHGIRPTDFKE